MSDRSESDGPGVFRLLGTLAVGGFVLFYMSRVDVGNLYTTLLKNAEEQVRQLDQIEKQKQLQAQKQKQLQAQLAGQYACYSAANPPPEARAPRDMHDTLSDMAVSLERITNNLAVRGIQRAIGQATLAGNTELVIKLRSDLLDTNAKRSSKMRKGNDAALSRRRMNKR